jgi:hypothetical protein
MQHSVPTAKAAPMDGGRNVKIKDVKVKRHSERLYLHKLKQESTIKKSE